MIIVTYETPLSKKVKEFKKDSTCLTWLNNEAKKHKYIGSSTANTEYPFFLRVTIKNTSNEPINR